MLADSITGSGLYVE